MASITDFFTKLIFQFRWTFMSQEKRYVYLWNRSSDHYRY